MAYVLQYNTMSLSAALKLISMQVWKFWNLRIYKGLLSMLSVVNVLLLRSSSVNIPVQTRAAYLSQEPWDKQGYRSLWFHPRSSQPPTKHKHSQENMQVHRLKATADVSPGHLACASLLVIIILSKIHRDLLRIES